MIFRNSWIDLKTHAEITLTSDLIVRCKSN